jgi:Family of unknown function (DUF6424)
VTTEGAERVWRKVFIAMEYDVVPALGRSGSIPVFDGDKWRIFKNYLTVFLGAENCADPAKVDLLRENVINLLEHYPETIPQLERLGVRVRALLNKRIETTADVAVWSGSIFNTGPVSKQPVHVHDTMQLAHNDIVIEVRGGKEPVYVIPAGPRGADINETVDFSVPGSKRRYGARHDFTRLAFTRQVPKEAKPATYRGKTAEGEPQRPRGRPRKDGLVPGSPEARRADRKKEREKEARRLAREARRGDVTTMPRRRKRLVYTKQAASQAS